MIIANGIAMLDIRAAIMGQTAVIHPTLIWDDTRVVLVDTGYPGQLPLFREAMAAAGKPLETVTDLILTHQDIDHIGGLPAWNEHAHARPLTWASEIERPYIQGDRMLVKITPDAVERALAALPGELPEERRSAFRNALLSPPKGPVDRLIGFGHAETPIAGIAVLDTPGHTPGHISLYHRASKTLIAGDALVLADGRLQLPSAALNSDDAHALRSLEQLEAMEIDAVICYHGGCFQGNVRTQLRELLA